MDDGWNSSASGADAWSGSATTVDYGNNIGRSYSNNTTLTGGDPSSTPSTSGAFSSSGGGGERGSGGGGGGGGGGYSRNLNPKAQLSVDRMPYETSVETIRNIFGRYGRIARVICDYKITEERLHVWLDYEDERVCESALRENGRKMEKSTIVVMKSSSGGGEDGFRSRGPKKDAWGNNTWNKDRNSGGGAAAANTSTASVEGADWSSADWSSGGDANTSSNDNYGDGEDRRSSRGRGRGGRDRGGRGGGRGRGGGGRYQPYDKNDSSFEKTELPPWEDILAGKSSSTPAASSASASDQWNTDDQWGSGGGSKEPSHQNTAPPADQAALDWD
ncbi:RNA-binding protein cabeza-like [Panonychus citri]|uniref:RNA-binding protein cabeza-like n=1 Tax=Panonychus citri TaxID=50023 RepID=UPI002307A32A|nr:RNA-binding protein cabeza-like [Panonychus citri]